MDKEVDKLRKEVYERINEFNSERNNLTKAINQKIDELVKGFGSSEEVSISFEELKLFKLGERNYVNKGIYFEKIEEGENHMKFLTYATSGGSFGVHFHDCIERCRILKGSLIEKSRGYKVYSEGEEVIYARKERHTPYASMDIVWEVTFYKKIDL